MEKQTHTPGTQQAPTARFVRWVDLPVNTTLDWDRAEYEARIHARAAIARATAEQA